MDEKQRQQEGLPERRDRTLSMAALQGFSLASAGLIFGGAAGFGYRVQWWGFPVGVAMVTAAALAAAAGTVLAVIGLSRIVGSRGRLYGLPTGLAALLIGLIVIAAPGYRGLQAYHSPGMVDVTTDPIDPPRLEVVALFHGGDEARWKVRPAVAKTTAGGAELFVAPLYVRVPPEKAFRAAVRAARDMLWVIAAARPAEGRIEATTATFWFGLRDDIGIRLSREGGMTRIDARALARGPVPALFGTNVRRIRDFFTLLRERLEGAELDTERHLAGAFGPVVADRQAAATDSSAGLLRQWSTFQ